MHSTLHKRPPSTTIPFLSSSSSLSWPPPLPPSPLPRRRSPASPPTRPFPPITRVPTPPPLPFLAAAPSSANLGHSSSRP
ncbi:hypothetical protein ZWY2020_020446 [Hordeum vulgare]|nr:hypothetical protein ZWY2020_020446 [Hordeum vulgare]